ncbi:MAG: PAS domain-containing protein [Clostridiales bacterium]|nr:PAS domain-containing protein [Clostridiales bacterium]
MKRNILITVVAVILLFAVATGLLAAAVLKSVAREQLVGHVTRERDVILSRLKGQDPATALMGLVSASRVTLIASEGQVLYDNVVDAVMENHLLRPEVQDALSTGTGSAIRYSETTRSTAVYVASRLADGSVLRVAAPERIARGVASGVAPWVIFGLMALVIVSVVLSSLMVDRLVKPVLDINLDNPEESRIYEELLPLVRRISEQNQNAKKQVAALEAKNQEQRALLMGMQEGFIALNEQGQVILINESACRMLGISQGEALGRPLLALCRDPAMTAGMEALREEGRAQGVLKKDGRSYVLNANRIEGRKDAVLLLDDQTEKLEGEEMRKRFTANVSHELRTPLTTICGYGEMLEAGMVQEGDRQQFYQNIQQESRRMLALVEDILRLSSLDEGALSASREQVNLKAVAERACQSLAQAARDKGLTLTCEGEDAFVSGDETLLFELCSNLIDNAIKYNVKDGRVDVSVTGGYQARLTVKDSGIGIAREHQPHVFERFYRTDTSRSKATGGTGLGLSIVKHAAEFHQANINLTSKPGEGTEITVTFPPAAS